jgi:hypothetical protein
LTPSCYSTDFTASDFARAISSFRLDGRLTRSSLRPSSEQRTLPKPSPTSLPSACPCPHPSLQSIPSRSPSPIIFPPLNILFPKRLLQATSNASLSISMAARSSSERTVAQTPMKRQQNGSSSKVKGGFGIRDMDSKGRGSQRGRRGVRRKG